MPFIGFLTRSSKPTEQHDTPASIVATDPENEAGSLDDTPLKFLTVRSFLMGILVSMGGFIFGYDTGACLHPGRPKGREAKSEAHRSDIGLSRDARFPPTLRYSCSQ